MSLLLTLLLACARPALADPGETVIRSAADLAAHDGEIVTLTGTYRTKRSLKGMPRPGKPAAYVDLGYVAIELGKATVDLGDSPRPPEERAALADQRVVVTGRLELAPEADGAAPAPTPRLVEITAVLPAR